jgi:hypothetical protein
MKNDPFEEKQNSNLQDKLFINEYNGAGQPYAGSGASTEVQDANRYIELYNAGDTDIELAGFTLEYGGKETWRGGSGDKIPAKGYFVIQGTKKGQYPGSGNMMSQGLSANNVNITLVLSDKNGAIIDQYEKPEDLNDHPTLKNTLHMRIPDGGTWYYCEISLASKGEANSASATASGVIQPMGDDIKEETLKVELQSVSPTSPTPDEDATITVKVADENAITSVVLKWKKGGANQPDVDITNSKNGDIYTATIPKQDDGTAVEWTIEATNSNGKKASKTGTVIFSAIPPDYTQLVINEVDGNGKFIEIYNKAAVAVSLKGFKLVKDETQTWWTGGDVSIAANGFYTVAQAGGASGANEYNGASGISPKKNVKFELKASDGTTVLDSFVRTNGNAWGDNVSPDYASGTPYSFSRIPDGTGDFKLAIPTCNATNGASAGNIVTN